MSFREKKCIINLNNLLFWILVIVYCLTATNEVGNEKSLYKYLIMIFCIIKAMSVLRKKKKEGYKPLLTQKYQPIIRFIGSIIVYTMIRSINAAYFSFRTIKELLFLVCPIIYGYLIINVLYLILFFMFISSFTSILFYTLLKEYC